jgi:hypothetical protein
VSEAPETSVHFMSLILAYHNAALQQLGKLADPQTGKAQKNLEAARHSIDLLETLEVKTRGNLSPDEEKTLREILTLLRLNFVEETKQQPTGDAAADTAGENGEETAAAAGAGEGEGEAGASSVKED